MSGVVLPIPPGYCACGQPLHYNDPAIRAQVERMIALADGDEFIDVWVHNGRGTFGWRVQRHYIALHGLKSRDLPTLGFEPIISVESARAH